MWSVDMNGYIGQGQKSPISAISPLLMQRETCCRSVGILGIGCLITSELRRERFHPGQKAEKGIVFRILCFSKFSFTEKGNFVDFT